jgi:hypothetical protein
MKIGFRAWLFWVVLLFGLVAPASAQLTVPPNPGKVTKRNLGDNGGSGASTGASAVTPSSSTVVVQYIAVTPVEAWANLEGKTMEARLLAFSAPAEGETGPVEIIREGKVRFLVSGRKEPVEYPLEQLGEAERTKIGAIARAAAKGPPK